MKAFASSNARYYLSAIVGVIVSLGIIVFAFQYALRETSKQFLDSFVAENARAFAGGDGAAIADRLTAISGGSNWVCLSASQDDHQFIDRRQGSSDCRSGPFQRHLRFQPKENPHISVEMTLRLPRSLEFAWIVIVVIQAACLLLIILTLTKAARERLLFEKQRDEDLRREESRRTEMLASLASQVAHDIRYPLGIFQQVFAELSVLPEDTRILISDAMRQMNKLSDSMLAVYKSAASANHRDGAEDAKRVVHTEQPEHLAVWAEAAVREQQRLYGSPKVVITALLDERAYGLFAKVDATQFRSIVSNLIKNSVESFDVRGGKVEISLLSNATNGVLQVRDTGKGIPAEILSVLRVSGGTHGKSGGHGIGLRTAMSAAAAWGGMLEIESSVGQGTMVSLTLPLSRPPFWYVSEICLPADSDVVALDDTAKIHEIWQRRISTAGPRGRDIRLSREFSPDGLRNWVATHRDKAADALFLLDYHLGAGTTTGLDLAEELGIAGRSILVTSAYDDPSILDRCRRLGVGLIPKSLQAAVPIRIVSWEPHRAQLLDGVLIDDTPHVIKNWEVAARLGGKRLRGFTRTRDFLTAIDEFDRKTPVYVDHSLGANEQGGEWFARDLKRLGFSTVILATAQSPEIIGNLPWITRVVDKTPPWSSAL